MQFTTNIDGKEYNAEIKGRTYRIYRETFKSDLILDYDEKRNGIMPLIMEQAMRSAEIDKALKAGVEIDYTSLPEPRAIGDIILKECKPEFLEHLAWVCLKTANPRLMGFNSFIDNIEDYQALLTFGTTCFDKIFESMTPVEVPVEEPEQVEEADEKKS